MCIMETLLPTKTDFALWDGITWLAADRSHSLYLYVVLWYLVSVYQEVMILFSLTGWIEMRNLCEIPVLCIRLIQIFGWKHSVISCHIWIYKHKSICSLSYRCTTFKTPDSFNFILKHRINLISCQIFLRLVRIWIDVCLSPKVAEGTA